MTPKAPRTPAGLGKAGRSLYRGVAAKFELEDHETALLIEACRVADLVERLHELVEHADLVAGWEAARPHVVELRQQRLLYGRLLAALRLPTEDDAGAVPLRPQRRSGLRGPYPAAVKR